MSRSAVAIRHVAFEDLGGFEPILREAGYAVRYLDVGIDDLPGLDPLVPDLVISLGGPVSASEDAVHPWLRQEVDLLAARLSAGLPTIGICLGAQLMARALGADVRPGPRQEIGLAPLILTAEGRDSPLAAFDGKPVLHWHADAFELPTGGTRLASTPACPNQAFAVDAFALGFQFHPEAGAPGFERWLIGHAVELAQAGVDVPALRADHARQAPELQRMAATCLVGWLRTVHASAEVRRRVSGRVPAEIEPRP